MSERLNLKSKLGLDVFKHDNSPHITIKAGMARNEKLKEVIKICPAGLYHLNEKGEVELNLDGCLECGSCRIWCGTELLDWNYPSGGAGVQYRFG